MLLVVRLLFFASLISWTPIVEFRPSEQFFLAGLLSCVGVSLLLWGYFNCLLLLSLGYWLPFIGSRQLLKQVGWLLCRMHDSGNFLFESCWYLTAKVVRLGLHTPSCGKCKQRTWSSVLIPFIPMSSSRQLSLHEVLMLFLHLLYQCELWKWASVEDHTK